MNLFHIFDDRYCVGWAKIEPSFNECWQYSILRYKLRIHFFNIYWYLFSYCFQLISADGKFLKISNWEQNSYIYWVFFVVGESDSASCPLWVDCVVIVFLRLHYKLVGASQIFPFCNILTNQVLELEHLSSCYRIFPIWIDVIKKIPVYHIHGVILCHWIELIVDV